MLKETEIDLFKLLCVFFLKKGGGGAESGPVAFEDLASACWMEMASLTDFPDANLRAVSL